MPANAAVSAPVKPSLTLKRRLNASPEKVFAAWTKPETLARWFGPRECTSLEARLDLRVGGRYHVTMIVPGDQHDVHPLGGHPVRERGTGSVGPAGDDAPRPVLARERFSHFVLLIQGVQVMDGKDPMYLHVQETSANSTWQPVIPTP